jgi:threonine synthase
MKYYSLNNPSCKVTFREAVVQGLAPDGGLYMPDRIPQLGEQLIKQFPEMSFQEIAIAVAEKFLDEDFSEPAFRKIVYEAITIDCPLVQVEENIYALELFHGPTLAFKDFGARFMARVLREFATHEQKEITVLVATSGDTGSAVAHGFYQVPGIRVVILYPDGKVSPLQEKQLASLGRNIQAVKISGSFDDCQRLVKEAFVDGELRSRHFLTSANSINIARWIPQSFYYFLAWSRLANKNKIIFSVPSGNFGNLTAGVLAKKMGLPVQAFVASTNCNDVVPEYLLTKKFKPRPSKQTISNAMDVGNPSNFTRLQALYENSWEKMSADIFGYAFTDEETRETISRIFEHTGYITDPHGAVGLIGLKNFFNSNSGCSGIFLATAHPAKFPEVMESVIHQPVSVPQALLDLKSKSVDSISCSSDYDDFKKLLLD